MPKHHLCGDPEFAWADLSRLAPRGPTDKSRALGKHCVPPGPRDKRGSRPRTRDHRGTRRSRSPCRAGCRRRSAARRGVTACTKSSPGGFVLAAATSQAGMAAARATASKYSATVPGRVSTWTIVPFSCHGQEHRDFGKRGPAHPAVLRVSPELRFEHGQLFDCAARSEE
jgi:hypothetical protein